MASDLVSDEAEKMQRVRMVWLSREDSAVERLGVRKAASVVVLERDLKRLVEGHWQV
jgi:hypothetical protein